jgi:hypothetical protein
MFSLRLPDIYYWSIFLPLNTSTPTPIPLPVVSAIRKSEPSICGLAGFIVCFSSVALNF